MTQHLDLAGLGAGPFNLSIAALLEGLNQNGASVRAKFFDQKASFSWHPGLLLPDARMQTSYLKDLVTGVDPTSPYTFLNYLVTHKRFYQFLSAELEAVSREEYADYLSWVARQLPTVEYNSRVESINYDGNVFELTFTDKRSPVKAANLCLGTGKQAHVPSCVKPHVSDNVFHAINIAEKKLSLKGKRVAIVGGGQTGAEILLNSIQDHWGEPSQVCWISRRQNFEPLDETPFTNEFFTPQYVNTFYQLPDDAKQRIVASQKLASDGISPDTLKNLYQKLYELSVKGEGNVLDLRPNRTLVNLQPKYGGYELELTNGMNHQSEVVSADVVILCTGFESFLPSYLAPLMDRINLDDDGQFQLNQAFQLAWDGHEQNRIFAVNVGRHSHGIAEPQMSLNCWRAATIINSLLSDNVFDLDQKINLVNWLGQSNFEESEPLEIAV